MAKGRTRLRKSRLKFDKQEVANRVVEFAEKDIRSRDIDRELRLQRYAKFRMWAEGKDFPWDNASDIPLPDMTEKSLQMQDTLYNAVMSQQPPIGAKANNKNDKERERSVDSLINYQVFVEGEGEKLIGDAADAFVNDGVYTILIPWVREQRELIDTKEFPAIPGDVQPGPYFASLIQQNFPRQPARPKNDGWDWTVGEAKVSFYTKDDAVEMVTETLAEVFNGPCPKLYDYDDVCHPPRAENLQAPGPSNPGGASHCVFIDHPSIDEIRRLAKSGFYDLITKDELDTLEGLGRGEDSYEEIQKDDLAGKTDAESDTNAKKEGNKSHNRLTRYLCFDTFDIDGDGIDEDVIWWVLRESKIMLKAKALTEMFPSNPPRRPIAEAAFLPVRGRRVGVSMLELLEGLHDAMKMLMDQVVDAGTAAIAPPWFYRPGGGMKPEVIRLNPAEGYPLGDPSRDVSFPRIGDPQAQGLGLNLMTILGQQEERLSVIGDLQFGRVPPGKSSALRNASSIEMLAGQGEARPERILRRFFLGLTQMWKQIHTLNQSFLPKDKQIRIAGAVGKEDPYQIIESRDQIAGKYQFTFAANILNTSKQAMQQSLMQLSSLYISEIAIQLGITDADRIYRLLRDLGMSFGQDADKYLKEPSPGASGPFLQAEEAIQVIMNGGIPDGRPEEGAIAHLQKLQAFVDPNQKLLQGEFKDIEGNEIDEFALMPPETLPVFQQYLQDIMTMAQEEQKQQQLLQAAQSFQSGGGEGGRPPAGGAPDQSPPQVSSGNELIDESLPGAQGRLT